MIGPQRARAPGRPRRLDGELVVRPVAWVAQNQNYPTGRYALGGTAVVHDGIRSLPRETTTQARKHGIATERRCARARIHSLPTPLNSAKADARCIEGLLQLELGSDLPWGVPRPDTVGLRRRRWA
jgi:hypothetical protein